MGFVASDIFEYIDYIPEMDIVYNYCIEAVNVCGESNWNCDLGFISEPGGDVNFDGVVDILDIVLIINIVFELYEPTDDEFIVSDINNDGLIDILDVVMIINIILVY